MSTMLQGDVIEVKVVGTERDGTLRKQVKHSIWLRTQLRNLCSPCCWQTWFGCRATPGPEKEFVCGRFPGRGGLAQAAPRFVARVPHCSKGEGSVAQDCTRRTSCRDSTELPPSHVLPRPLRSWQHRSQLLAGRRAR